jgi:cytochrome c oxidase subunit 2
MPPNHTVDGHRIDAILRVSMGLTAALAAAFVLALAHALYRAHRRASEASPEAAAPPAVAIALGLAVLIFGLIDVSLSLRSRRAAKGPPPSDALRVEVLAQQWAWRFRYAGPDDVFGTADDVTTLNDLRLPAGRAVSLQVRSLDIVHSFYVPLLNARADIYPGRTASTWFRTTRDGRGEIACTVLCGDGHYQMRGEVTVLSDERYSQWMSELPAAPPAGAWAWER